MNKISALPWALDENFATAESAWVELTGGNVFMSCFFASWGRFFRMIAVSADFSSGLEFVGFHFARQVEKFVVRVASIH